MLWIILKVCSLLSWCINYWSILRNIKLILINSRFMQAIVCSYLITLVSIKITHLEIDYLIITMNVWCLVRVRYWTSLLNLIDNHLKSFWSSLINLALRLWVNHWHGDATFHVWRDSFMISTSLTSNTIIYLLLRNLRFLWLKLFFEVHHHIVLILWWGIKRLYCCADIILCLKWYVRKSSSLMATYLKTLCQNTL